MCNVGLAATRAPYIACLTFLPNSFKFHKWFQEIQIEQGQSLSVSFQYGSNKQMTRDVTLYGQCYIHFCQVIQLSLNGSEDIPDRTVLTIEHSH